MALNWPRALVISHSIQSARTTYGAMNFIDYVFTTAARAHALFFPVSLLTFFAHAIAPVNGRR